MSDTSVGTAHGAIDIDLSGLHAAIKQSHGIMGQLEQSINRAGAASDSAARQFGGMGEILRGVAQGAGQMLAQAMADVAGSIAGVGRTMIDSNAEFERYAVQFGVLLGSTEAAQERLDELATFGATTPFDLPGVVRADKILQAFGLHVDDAVQRFGKSGTDIRRIAGDVAAGTGAEFEEIATYIGKFSAGATGEAIARFQELGIVTKQQLTEMGLTFDKGGALVIKSQADLDRATGILLEAMQQKYGGMMEAQSATFEGMMSNLEDWTGQTLRTLGAPIFEVLKTQLADLLKWLPSIQPQIEAAAQRMAAALGAIIPRVVALVPRLVAAARVLTDMVRAISDVAAGFRDSGMGDVVANLIDGFARLAEAAQDAGAPFVAAWGEGGLAGVLALVNQRFPFLQETLTNLQQVFQPLIDAVQPVVDGFGEGGLAGVLALVNQRFPFLQETLTNLQQVFQPLIDAVQPVVDGFGEGGLAGGFTALRDNILPILSALSDLRVNLAALALDSLGTLVERLGDNAGFADFLRNLGLSNAQVETVNRVLEKAGEIFHQVGAAVKEVADWFQQKLQPAVVSAGSEFATMLLPHLEMLGTILVEDVFPILKDVGQFLMDNLPGAINVVAPLLTSLVDGGLSAVELALRAIGAAWREVLKPAFEAIGGWLEDLTGGWDNLARGAGVVRDTFADIAQGIRDMANTNPLETVLKLPGMPGFGLPGMPSAPPADDAPAGRSGGGWGALQGRASGGPIRAGQPYVVGERGPELIIPATNGQVLPAAQGAALTASALPGLAATRGAPALTVQVAINHPVVDNAERLNQFAAQIADATGRAVAEQWSAAMDGVIVSGGPV